MPSAENANIARHLPFMAAQAPARPALKIPRGRTRAGDIDYLTLSFAELDAEADAWVRRLSASGVRPGDRVLVMVRQGLPLIAAVFALFKAGAVPVVIDPGMGLKNFLACVARSRPRALLGIPLAQLLSRIFRPSFSSVAVRIGVSNAPAARVVAAQSEIQNPESKIINRAPTDLAAVLFTSGSTGAPKGVCYEHGMFEAQIRLIRDTYGIAPGEIDLPMLPLFALFNPALGMTTIVPEIDPARPAAADPAKIVQAIRQENVTTSFGSPTLWGKVGAYCVARRLTLPSLRRVLCAGAPVPAALWEQSRRFLPQGQLHSPYGATEALPVSTIGATEIESLKSKPQNPPGACVGHPLPGNEVKIVALHDGPLATLTGVRELPAGEIGEIIVRGPVVTQTYDALPAATALAKIQAAESDPSGSVAWHRLGDCGGLDAAGRLWFCGRKAERVETAAGPLYTEPCERVFRGHPSVARCALIGLGPRGRQIPALVVEPAPGAALHSSRHRRTFARGLRALALSQPGTAAIKRFYFHPHFPVDVRHNAKIHRLALARWAATAKGYESDPKR